MFRGAASGFLLRSRMMVRGAPPQHHPQLCRMSTDSRTVGTRDLLERIAQALEHQNEARASGSPLKAMTMIVTSVSAACLASFGLIEVCFKVEDREAAEAVPSA